MTDERIELLERLGSYMLSDDPKWKQVKEQSQYTNPWFIPQDLDHAIRHIATTYLDGENLKNWLKAYHPPAQKKIIGIVMAGNIPLVGFHDFLCGFAAGHCLRIKTSSKDNILLPHLIVQLQHWDPALSASIQIADQLKGCDAYIATGSNNSARYFTHYFGRFPHMIRKNRTSAAILDGSETDSQLLALGQDIFRYFGLGCRNVTQIHVPIGYDFQRLLHILEKFSDRNEHHKYRNNYDHHLALYLLNKIPYQTNGSVLLVENKLPFTPVSVLHFDYYEDPMRRAKELRETNDIQFIAGQKFGGLGVSQHPALTDYADGVDTMAFLTDNWTKD